MKAESVILVSSTVDTINETLILRRIKSPDSLAF